MHFGTFLGPVPGKKSLRVSAADGEERVVDAGQIVGVWQPQAMRGDMPGGPEAWPLLQQEARRLLSRMPPRSLDLHDLWKLARGKGKGVVLSTCDVARWLFGGGARRGGKQHAQSFQLTSQQGHASSDFELQQQQQQPVWAPSAAERVAAGLVLAADLQRFKRVPCVLRHSDPVVSVCEGGFKPVDQSVVATNQAMSFATMVKDQFSTAQPPAPASDATSDAAAAAAPAPKVPAPKAQPPAPASDATSDAAAAAAPAPKVPAPKAPLSDASRRQIVHSLEMLALGGSADGLLPQAKAALRQMGHEPTAAAAHAVLVQMGAWTERARKPSAGTAASSSSAAAADGGAAAAASSDAKPVVVVPWSAEALRAAADVAALRRRREAQYARGPLAAPRTPLGAPLPNGRRDYRGAAFSVYCVDAPSANFYDDAVSWDPDARELLIHVVDAQLLVEDGGALDAVAQARVCTQYLPRGPLFMMPPAALQAIAFSADAPNEAITVALTIDPDTGAVTGSRLMLTVLPPVVALTHRDANAMLEGGHDQLTAIFAAATARRGGGGSGGGGTAVAATPGTLKAGAPLMQRDRAGAVRAVTYEDTAAHAMVDAALALFTEAAARVCADAGAAMPVLVGLEGRVRSGRARFGTAPLRRYVDLLAQRQLCAVLGRRALLGKRRVADAVAALTQVSNARLAARAAEDAKLKWEALEEHCARSRQATGLPYAAVPARGTGRGNEVVVDGLGVSILAGGRGGRREWRAGQPLTVRIYKVNPDTRHVRAEPE